MGATAADWMQAWGTVVAAGGVLYVAAEKRQSLPHIKFDFGQGSISMGLGTNDASTVIDLYHQEGLVRNLSTQQDTITRVAIVIWHNEKMNQMDFFFDATAQAVITNKGMEGEVFKVPFNIPGRSAHAVDIKIADVDLGKELSKLVEGKDFHPSFGLKPCFQTTDGTWFDITSGTIVNIDSASMRAQYEGYLADMHHRRLSGVTILRQLWPLYMRLVLADLRFFGRRLKRQIGL